MKTVTIVGVGALGSNLVVALRNLPIKVRVIDFDRVESKNTQAQFFTKTDIGLAKVTAIQNSMMALWRFRMEGFSVRLVKDNANTLLKGDLIVDCVDNKDTRVLISETAKVSGIPVLHGALAPNGEFARIMWDELFVPDSETGLGATCEDGAHLPFITQTSSLIAQAISEFVSTGRKVGYELSRAHLRKFA